MSARTASEIVDYLASRFKERACQEALRQSIGARAARDYGASKVYLEAAIRLCQGKPKPADPR